LGVVWKWTGGRERREEERTEDWKSTVEAMVAEEGT